MGGADAKKKYLELEPRKNGLALQHCKQVTYANNWNICNIKNSPGPGKAKHGERIHACVNSTSQHSVSIASLYHPAREDICLVLVRIYACVNSTSQHSVSIASLYHPARDDICLVIVSICSCINSTSQHSVSIASFYHPAREDFCLVIVSICSCINFTSVSMASASPRSIILQERISA